LLSDSEYGSGFDERRHLNRIADERGIYYRSSGLLRAVRNAEMPEHRYAAEGRRARASGEPVVERAAIGLFGFYAGPSIHIVDIYGLADPLLARLPSRINPGWRVGHFVRVVPEGYIRSLETGENRFRDENLGEYYEKLRTITRGSLFNWERWLTIWKMNIGSYDHLIDYEAFRYPGLVRRKLSQVRGASLGSRESPMEFTRSGIEISLGEHYLSQTIQIALDQNDDYEIVYLQEDRPIARQRVRRLDTDEPGLKTHLLNVPAEAARKGYDRIRIFPLGGDKLYRMGTLRLR
jgi:arabinofuranosyltransferase